MIVLAHIILEERDRLERLISLYEDKIRRSFKEDQRKKYLHLLGKTKENLLNIQKYIKLAEEDVYGDFSDRT